MSDKNVSSAVRDFWSKRSKQQTQERGLILRWWQHPYVLQKINERVCGKMLPGPSTGLNQRVKDQFGQQLPLKKAVSVGAGNGIKEINMIRQGIVEEFDLFELSPVRIAQGKEHAARLGVAEQIHFYDHNVFDEAETSQLLDDMMGKYNMVHWNNALHHMMNTWEALEWSYKVLKSGGLFYMDDFVGPAHFQYDNATLELASSVRKAMPQEYLQDPRQPGKFLPTTVLRPAKEVLIADDPSEAADSNRILDGIRHYFPDADIIHTGGVIYLNALNDMLHNFSIDPVDPFLPLLMLLDFQAADNGLTHYAVALAQKT